MNELVTYKYAINVWPIGRIVKKPDEKSGGRFLIDSEESSGHVSMSRRRRLVGDDNILHKLPPLQVTMENLRLR